MLIAIFAAIYLTASKFTPHTSGYIKVGDSNFAVVVDLQAAHPFAARRSTGLMWKSAMPSITA